MSEDRFDSKKNDEQEPKTTGYEWDGIKEYDNPDPAWLRYLFYATLLFSLGYWALYPSWPTPNNTGALEWSSSKELAQAQAQIEHVRMKYQEGFDKASFEEILNNPELLQFALAGGESAFQNNCSVCHGVGGGGNPGYPNLTVDAWIWGGKVEDIYTTLKYGIRSGHEETRDSNMPAFKDKLSSEEINGLATYISGGLKDSNSKSVAIFARECASCHGDKGQGIRDVGAPALNDAVWLYGPDKYTIKDVITNGRGGVMPYWTGKLTDSTIRQLAIYVHELGGGE